MIFGRKICTFGENLSQYLLAELITLAAPWHFEIGFQENY